MLHGNPGWSYHYRRLIAALRPRHRCIVPDHIGMGRSSRPLARDYPHTLSRRVQDLSVLLDTVVPEGPIHFLVHDWGAMIGLAWAVRHPERVGRLVVLNGAAFPLPAGKSLHWTLRLARVALLGPLLVRGLNLFCLGVLRYGVCRAALSPGERAACLAPYRGWSARRAVQAFVEDIPLGPGDAAWSTVQETARALHVLAERPMLIAWGMRDFVFDGDFLAEWQRCFPRAEVHRFPAAGHWVLEDEPEALGSLIADFLAAGGDSSGGRESAAAGAGV